MSRERISEEIRQRLGRRPLNRTWAKLEIALGLLAAGAGLMLGQFGLTQSSPEWAFAAAGLALFVLGGYLALAGHRSHLYQAANEDLGLLLEELRQHHAKGSGI